MVKCSNNNKDEMLDYLKGKPTENSLLMGDTENFSFYEDFIDAWLMKRENNITSVLMRYFKHYTLSTIENDDIEELSQKVLHNADWQTISGIEEVINRVSGFIKIKEIKLKHLAELNKSTYIKINTNIVPIKATIDDLEELFTFYMSIEELEMTEESRESFGQEVITNTGSIYFIKIGGQIIAAATITAVNSMNGTVIGVATDKNYRGQGYAKACLSKLCSEVISLGKMAVLFYDNPIAGKLYKSIGFVDVNRWAIGTTSSA